MNDQLPTTTEDEVNQEVESLDPAIIVAAGTSLLNTDYETAKTKLKELYENNSWTDPEMAGQYTAQVFNNLNHANNIAPEVTLTSDVNTLAKKILDPKLSEDLKLTAIEEWREQTKESLYNSKSADKLVSGTATEQLIDAYATQFRRDIVSKDVSRPLDMLTRGIEAAIAPIAGVSDLAFGTNLEESLRKKAADYTNPKYDESLASIAASGVGSVGGFALAALNPYTAWGYLGATLADQGKTVYDTAYAKTNSHEAARDALLQSSPGIALGITADRIVGGSLGAILKGQKGYLNAITGMAAGAGGFAAQSYGTGAALANVTGDETYKPTPERLAKEALVGGAIGTIIGGARDLGNKISKEASEFRITKAREEIQKQMDVPTKPETEEASNLMAEQFVIKPTVKETEIVTEEPVDASAVVTKSYGKELDAIEEADVTKVLAEPKDKGYVPIPLILEQVRELGVKPEMADMTKYWAFVHTPSKQKQLEGVQPKLVVMRQIFKDQEQAETTLSHEFGHILDSYSKTKEAQSALVLAPDRKESVALKLLRFNRDLLSNYDDIDFKLQAERLSKAWRPGWDYKPKYRANTTEVQADVVSAMFNKPEWVREQFPRIAQAFEKGLEAHPEAKDFWNKVQELKVDPEKHLAWFENKRQASRIKEAEIYTKAQQTQLEKKAEIAENLPKEAVSDTMAKTINAFHAARQAVNKAISKGISKETMYGIYNKLYSSRNAYKTVDALLNMPLKKIYEEYITKGIPGSEKDALSTWKDYEHLNRTLNDSNALIEDIRKNPEKYKDAVQDIRNLLRMTPDEEFNRDIDPTNLSDWPLVTELAKLHHEFLEPATRTKLRKKLLDAGKLEAASLLEEKAFNVRSLIGNPDATRREAESHMATLKNKLGPEKFKALQEHSKKYHEIFSVVTHALDEAGLLSPEMKSRLEINKDNYITTNVLKYFEEDPTISSSLRSAYGTIDDVGDELAATEMKMKALMTRAELQKAYNSAVNLARHAGNKVEAVPAEYDFRAHKGVSTPYAKNVYEQKAELQKGDPHSSYLIEYEDGKPTLYKVDSPNFARMFESKKLDKIPVVGYGLGLIDSFYKYTLAREAKTILSLPFVLSSRFFYDVGQEAITARSFKIPFLPFHTNKAARSAKKEALELATKAHDLGVIDPKLKDIIERNGIPYLGSEGWVGENTAQEAFVTGIYNHMGIDVPGEETINMPMRVSKTLNELAEKIPFMKTIKRRAAIDELATKIAGSLIGQRVRGMGPEEAAVIAREYHGTPDPTGGGTEAANINKLFLFGRAHINAMRAIANQFKDDPKGFGTQYIYHKLIPRLMVHAGIMGPLVGALFGEDAEKITRKALNKISEFDKISKFNIPYGWKDDKGNFKWLYDVKPDDINYNWKVATIRTPINRDLVAMDQLFTPVVKFFEELADTGEISLKHIGQSVRDSLAATVGGNIAPPIQFGANTYDMLTGTNPTDYFRNKQILPKDVQEAGSFFTKLYTYLGYTLFSQYPSLFNYKFKEESTEPTSVLEWISRVPQAGPLISRLVGETNYGDYENTKELEQQKIERDAEIRLNMGTSSRKLFNEYRKAQAIVSKLGKDWKSQVSTDYVNKVIILQRWHARNYTKAFNNMRTADETNDTEQLAAQKEALEESSDYYLQAIE